MTKIKIYVICHKKAYIPQTQCLYPIQVGASNSNELLPNMLYDNVGDNISKLNPDYCELTGMYWVWKNETSDYVGLFHYRRYLLLNNNAKYKKYDWWKHFYNFITINDKICKNIGFDGSEEGIITKYDLIIPYPSELKYRGINTFYDTYSNYKTELDFTFNIVRELYPSYEKALEKCKNGSLGYHCNMFIMKREIYEEYCTYLFSVLDKVYGCIKSGELITEKKRLIGYLAEFLTGIFFIYKEDQLESSEKMLKVPGIFFKYTDGKSHLFESFFNLLNNFIYHKILAPMGSKREKLAYKLLDKFRKTSV